MKPHTIQKAIAQIRAYQNDGFPQEHKRELRGLRRNLELRLDSYKARLREHAYEN
jgi:hypothetical protein